MNVHQMPACQLVDLKDWRADLCKNVLKQSVAIAAVYSAAEALETIRKHREEQIVGMYMARAAADTEKCSGNL